MKNKKLTKAIIFAGLVLLPLSGSAGIDRIDVAPAGLVSLNQGHSGQFMGGALTTDLYFTRSFAFRGTIGFTKDRRYPAELDYSQADYGFWLSMAPYYQINLGRSVSPYLTLLGTFASGSYPNRSVAPPIGMERAPFARLQQDARDQGYFSLGASLGTKVRLSGPVHVFGEISHYFFTTVSDDRVVFGTDQLFPGREFDLERNPTYISLGLSFSFRLAGTATQ